jgi:hypothetical protein
LERKRVCVQPVDEGLPDIQSIVWQGTVRPHDGVTMMS